MSGLVDERINLMSFINPDFFSLNDTLTAKTYKNDCKFFFDNLVKPKNFLPISANISNYL